MQQKNGKRLRPGVVVDLWITHADKDHINAEDFYAEFKRYESAKQSGVKYVTVATAVKWAAEQRHHGKRRTTMWGSFSAGWRSYSLMRASVRLRRNRLVHGIRPVKIAIPPGHLLLRIADLFLPKKLYQRCEEHVADLREEVYEAARDGKHMRARLLPWVYLIATAVSLLSAIPAKMLEQLKGAVKK